HQDHVVARRRQRAVGLVGNAYGIQLAAAVERQRLREIEKLRIDSTDGADGGIRRWHDHERNHIPARRSGGAPVRRSRARRRGRRCMIRTFRNRLTSTRQQEHTMTEAIVNNGVNVGALLAAREALKGAPQAAKFTWRASCKWKNGTHSVS